LNKNGGIFAGEKAEEDSLANRIEISSKFIVQTTGNLDSKYVRISIFIGVYLSKQVLVARFLN
jgi:hypothetical protein